MAAWPLINRVRLAAAVVLLLGLAGPATAQGWPFPLFGWRDCCGKQELWVVDAAQCPDTCDLEAGFRQIRYHRRDGLGRWTEFSFREFVTLLDPSLSTTFFVHGYHSKELTARIDGHALARAASSAAPFRSVIWLWPADHQLGIGPQNNLATVARQGDKQGYYLARVLDALDPRSSVMLIGHSFGTQPVCAALHGLAARQVACWPLPCEPHERCGCRQAMLIGSAIGSCDLAPGGRYGLAITEVDRMLIFYNDRDRVLRLMSRVTGDDQLLGLTGLPGVGAWGELAPRVIQVDVQRELHRGHWVFRYLINRPTLDVLQSFLGAR